MVYEGQSQHADEDFDRRSAEWCVVRCDEGRDPVHCPCFESVGAIHKSKLGDSE